MRAGCVQNLLMLQPEEKENDHPAVMIMTILNEKIPKKHTNHKHLDFGYLRGSHGLSGRRVRRTKSRVGPNRYICTYATPDNTFKTLRYSVMLEQLQERAVQVYNVEYSIKLKNYDAGYVAA